ncbi:MAG: DNA alkylation repair protein [Planctomycetota bacterium]
MKATEAIAWLRRKASANVKKGMARYAIPDDRALGVTVGVIRAFAKQVGRDHALAQQLWASGIYEAQMLAAFVDDPAAVTPKQMNAWAKDFDNWATCDTACFHLFDRTGHVFARARAWAKSKHEFTRRAAFALVASAALHRKDLDDAEFSAFLPVIERAAVDGRNFVKKAVSWALRSVGRRSLLLHGAAIELAEQLAASADAAARWVGKDALRDLRRPAVQRALLRARPSSR